MVEAFLMISRTAEYALRSVVKLGSNPGNRLGVMHRRLDRWIAKIGVLFGATTMGQLLAEQNAS
jgi:hypothetical protein